MSFVLPDMFRCSVPHRLQQIDKLVPIFNFLTYSQRLSMNTLRTVAVPYKVLENLEKP